MTADHRPRSAIGGHFWGCVSFVYIKNRPAHSRRAIGSDLCYPSTSKASPNDTGIVIIIIIIIGEVVVIEHRGADYSTSNANTAILFCNICA
jgi:hypothetical protein